ncbi:MAG: CsbD family protein [Clostridia bacterium]
MSEFKSKVINAKDKFAGEVKETVGKAIGNEELELKGKIQSSQAELKEKMDIGDKLDKAKEEIAGKINDLIDKNKV